MMEEPEQNETKVPAKVYSPDIPSYSFEGNSYFFGTLLSLLCAPIRIVSRVVHNIFILPGDLKEEYAKALFLVSSIMFALGIYDLLIRTKWALATSQIFLIFYAIKLKRQAKRSVDESTDLRIVEIDTEEVGGICEEIYDELNDILGGNEN